MEEGCSREGDCEDGRGERGKEKGREGRRKLASFV